MGSFDSFDVLSVNKHLVLTDTIVNLFDSPENKQNSNFKLNADIAIDSEEYNSSEIFDKCKNLREKRDLFTLASAKLRKLEIKQESTNIIQFGDIIAEEVACPIMPEGLPLDLGMEVDYPMPGKGKKFMFKSLIGKRIINVMLDTGSSTTLVLKSLISDLNLSYYTSRLPVNFLGMFGNKMVPDAKVASLAIDIKGHQVALPAYILDSLPYSVDLLIGTDQLGKSLGISIDLSNNFSISLFDSSNQIRTFFLGKERELVSASPGAVTLDQIKSSSSEKSSCESHSLMTNLDGVFQLVDSQSSQHPKSAYGENDELLVERPIVIDFDTKADDPILISVKLELENIKNALDVLRKEMEQLPPKKEIAPNVRNSRKLNVQIKLYNTKRDDLIAEFMMLIEALSRELRRLRKKYHKKKHKLVRKDNRSKREKKKVVTEKVNLVTDRYINSTETNASSLCNRDGASITPGDILDLIIDNGLYNRNMNPEAVMNEIFKSLALDITSPIPDNHREEIVNLIHVASQKIEESDPDVADWMNEVKRRDVLIYHHLLSGEADRLNEILEAYSTSVLMGPTDQLTAGQATIKGEPIKYHIELIPEGLAVLQKKKKKPYANKRPLRNLMKSTTEEMERAGVGRLNPLNFQATFASPAFFVKNKAKFRLVCDFKDLNAVTTDDIYPLPHMDYIFENLGSTSDKEGAASYFSILDLKSGYWQIPLDEMAQKLAAILLPFGTFQFVCLPFGLKNAPAFFQRYMDKVLDGGLGNYVFVYIDDIVIFSESFDKHMEHLRSVLGFLKESNLKANIEKCHFCLSQLKVLGKIVSKEGVSTDPDLIKAMVEFPSPGLDIGNLAKKKLKRFLAMLSYYRTHVQDFGPHTDLLSKFLKDDFVWERNSWREEHEKAFKFLKELMLKAPILAFPNMAKPFYMQSDASKVGAGAVLYQLNESDQRCVVSYASWLFSDTQRRYNTTERELLGLILAVRKWKPFFFHTKFFAETDHQALVGYLKLDDPFGKIARWAAELAQFSFEIKHIKGELNVPSDTLSRTAEEVRYFDLFSCDTETADEYISSNRPSKVLSKAFSVEDVELYSCVESDENENLIFTNSLYFSMPYDQEWKEAQRADPYFGPIITWLEKGALPKENMEAEKIARNIKFYALNSSGILVYSSESGERSFRKCVPQKFRRLVLSECHDSLWSGGHLGRDKTKDKIVENYYFPRMNDYIDLWIKTCPICLATKRKHPTKLIVPLGSLTASRTMELLSIDLWDAGVISGRGNKYVLTVIDAYSKFAMAIPMKKKTAEAVASKLYKHVFSTFGRPERLHSDNGLEFCNKILAEVCRLYKIEKSHTTAYHPQGNAIAERIHQYFRNALAAFVGRDQRDWDLLLPSLISVYLDSVHTSLGGFSPSQIMFARKLGNPRQSVVEDGPPETSIQGYALKMQLALDRAQEIVQKIMTEKTFDNIKPSLGKKTLSYNVGDKVGLKVESLPAGVKSAKLFPRYSGPFTVVKASHEGKVLLLADANSKERKVPTSILNVKPWPDRQTLLEQYENFEILKRNSKTSETKTDAPLKNMVVDGSKVASDKSGQEFSEGELISAPQEQIIETPSEIIEHPNDIIITPEIVNTPEIINKTPLEKPIAHKPSPIDRRLEFDDDDYDIMGNPIYDSDFVKSKVLTKVDSLSHSMFYIEEIEHFRSRNFINPSKTNLKCLNLDVYCCGIDTSPNTEAKCISINIR